MIRRTLNRLRAHRSHRALLSEQLLTALASELPQARFVEIGANDGEQHDHINAFLGSTEWSGVMVEPVDYIFERLAANHGSNDRIVLEQAVVSGTDGTVPFFYLSPPLEEDLPGLPDWYDGVGSLSREAVLSHRDEIPDIDERLRCRNLPSMTIDSLCAKTGLERFDLLVVDTEGYDAELLATVDLDRYRPHLIIYEHFHLGAADRAACRRRLGSHGYETREEGFDTLCVSDAAPAGMRRTWRRVPPLYAGVYVESEVPA